MARWLAFPPFPARLGENCGQSVNAAEYDPRKSDLEGRMVALAAAAAAPQPPAGESCLVGLNMKKPRIQKLENAEVVQGAFLVSTCVQGHRWVQ